MIIFWKFLWQAILIIALISFIFMFIKFSYEGFIDLKKMLKNKSDE